MVDGRLLQTDKPFSQLKQSQKEKINEWLYQEYSALYRANGKPPDSRYNDAILNAAYRQLVTPYQNKSKSSLFPLMRAKGEI